MTFQPEQIASVVLKDADSVLARLKELNVRLDELHKPVIQEFQQVLFSLENASFNSFSQNHNVAAEVQVLLNRLGCRVQCPKLGCNQGAAVDCRICGGAKKGIFLFRHLVKGVHTNHVGSTKLPHLKLVPALPQVRRNLRKISKKR